MAKPKLALTRERILNEGVAYADEHGVDALTMRKLADRLGAGAMSLYTHVANKDAMIEGMVDVISAEIELPGDAHWRDALHSSAASAHAVLLDHAWAAPEWSRRMPGPARLQYMESVLRTLTNAGLDDSTIYRGYHAVTMHVVGFTIQALGYRDFPAGADPLTLAEDFVGGLDKSGLPHLAHHVRAHLSEEDHGDEFGFVLDLILDGLEAASRHQ